MKYIVCKIIIAITLLNWSVVGINAQSVYYYYDKEKVYLNVDNNRIALSLKDTILLKNDIANDQLVFNFSENTSVVYTQEQVTTVRNFYSEIDLTTAINTNSLQIAGLTSTLNNLSYIDKISPCFKTNDGKKLGLTNRFYVKIKPNGEPTLYSYASTKNVQVVGRHRYMNNWYILSCNKNNSKNALEYANMFYETGLFLATEPEFIYHDLVATNDTYYNDQWGLNNIGQYHSDYVGLDINIEDAWRITKGSNNIKVAIYDHGFEMNHPDLRSNVYGTGFDASTGTSPSQVRGSHGTACAGIIGAVGNNNLGIVGVAPQTNIVSISIRLILSDTPEQLASGFNWAWENGVDVISNSWGGYNPSSIITDAIREAINNGRNGKGCIVVLLYLLLAMKTIHKLDTLVATFQKY